jgi:glycosyltransferase involved in cell wall biosynthesis
MNVLLIGHACGPGMGSEPGFTWNWAQFLSRNHQVWVLCHPQYRSKIDEFMLANRNPKLQFVWVTPESVFDPWRPERGEQGIRLHYFLWLPKAYQAARELCRTIDFDIAHHVSWGTVGAAPPLWRLPVPSVWGPIGGGQCVPSSFLSYFGWRKWPEILRTCYVKMLRFSPSLRKAARKAAVVLATNIDTEELLERIPDVKVRRFLDCGLPPSYVPADLPSCGSEGEFTLLWAGRLEHRKGLALALRALAKVKGVRANLLIAGTGGLRPKLEKLAFDLGLKDQVKFLGAVPYHEMSSLFERCHALLFSSLRDSFGSVVLEAMAHGLPILTFNHQGVGTFVPDNAGIKVPLTTPSETIQALATAIKELAVSEALRDRMKANSWSFAREQTWDRRAERMGLIYEEVLSRATHDQSRAVLNEANATR